MKHLLFISLLLFSLSAFTQPLRMQYNKDECYFDTKDYQLMDSVVEVLRDNPSYTVSVYGHAHHREMNNRPYLQQELSYKRATRVMDYFLSQLIDLNRIVEVRGLGTSQPINRDIPYINWRAEIFINKK